MIHFNNEPPRQPGDLVLTESALGAIHESAYHRSETFRQVRARNYGRNVGEALVRSMDPFDPDQAMAIAAPVAAEFDGESAFFRSGLIDMLEQQVQRGQEVAA